MAHFLVCCFAVGWGVLLPYPPLLVQLDGVSSSHTHPSWCSWMGCPPPIPTPLGAVGWGVLLPYPPLLVQLDGVSSSHTHPLGAFNTWSVRYCIHLYFLIVTVPAIIN